MTDWKVTGNIEHNNGNWVYYAYTAANALFQAVHFSRNVDVPRNDHTKQPNAVEILIWVSFSGMARSLLN